MLNECGKSSLDFSPTEQCEGSGLSDCSREQNLGVFIKGSFKLESVAIGKLLRGRVGLIFKNIYHQFLSGYFQPKRGALLFKRYLMHKMMAIKSYFQRITNLPTNTLIFFL